MKRTEELKVRAVFSHIYHPIFSDELEFSWMNFWGTTASSVHLDDMSGFISLSVVPAAYDPLERGSGNIFPN